MRQYKSKATGKIYPSVTSVLPPFLWGNEEAKERGTAVHLACKQINYGNLDWDSVHPIVEPYVKGYELLLKETGFKPELSEFPVVSDLYHSGGTIDVVGTLGKHRVIADYKTGTYSKIQPNWELQLAAYYKLYKETTGDKRKYKLMVFVLRKEEDYKIFEMKELDAWTVFLSYLRTWNWERRFE